MLCVWQHSAIFELNTEAPKNAIISGSVLFSQRYSSHKHERLIRLYNIIYLKCTIAGHKIVF